MGEEVPGAIAPEVSRVVAPAHAEVGGIHAFAWQAWPWFAWILPALLAMRWLLPEPGWDALILLISAPLYVPAIALLSLLPRFILRKRGARVTPPQITWLLFLTWWSWLTFPLLIESVGDSGGSGTTLGHLTGWDLSDTWMRTLLMLVVLLIIVAGILILAIASADDRPRRGRGWTITARVCALPVVPALVVATAIAGTATQTDAAGQIPSVAAAAPIADQSQRAVDLYDVLQRRFSVIRAALPDARWTMSSDLDDDALSCRSTGVTCYAITMSASLVGDAPADAGQRLRAALDADGWTITDTSYEFEATDETGTLITGDLAGPTIRLELTSARFWGSAYDIMKELGAFDGPRQSASQRPPAYASDEWPPLV